MGGGGALAAWRPGDKEGERAGVNMGGLEQLFTEFLKFVILHALQIHNLTFYTFT